MYYLIKNEISSNNLTKCIIFKIPKSLIWPPKSPNPPKLFSVPALDAAKSPNLSRSHHSPSRSPKSPKCFHAIHLVVGLYCSSPAWPASPMCCRLPSSLRYVLFSRILSPSLRSAAMASRNCFKISINVCMNHEIARATTLLSCWLLRIQKRENKDEIERKELVFYFVQYFALILFNPLLWFCLSCWIGLPSNRRQLLAWL